MRAVQRRVRLSEGVAKEGGWGSVRWCKGGWVGLSEGGWVGQ